MRSEARLSNEIGGEIERRSAVIDERRGAVIDDQCGATIDDRSGAIVRLELGLWLPAKSLRPLSLRFGLSLLSLSLSLSFSRNDLK